MMKMDTSFYQSPFSQDLRDEGRVEGRAEGRAEGLFHVLDARGIFLTEQQREHVAACTDIDQIREWTVRAATATTAAEVFDADLSGGS